MSLRMRVLWLGAMALVVGGCGSDPEPKIEPVAAPNQYFDAMSVSTRPPEGERWWVLERHDAETSVIIFNQKPTDEEIRQQSDRMLSVTLMVRRIDEARRPKPPTPHEFLKDWRRQLVQRDLKGALRLSLSAAYEKFGDGECLRFTERTAQGGDADPPDTAETANQEGFVCIHPKDPGLAVTVLTSQYHQAGSAAPSIKPLHDSFVSNLVFKPGLDKR